MRSAQARGRRRVAIVDPCCGAGYSPATLATGGLGGTEATVLRISTALGAWADIEHFQKGREAVEATPAGVLRPLPEAFAPMTDATLVVINSWKVACKLRKAHPDARILLWLHVYPGRHNRPMAAALVAARIDVVCVSRTHEARLRAFLGSSRIATTHIHNPVADDLAPDATPRDRDRLLFASSPHKGLAQVFGQFAAARARIPGLALVVADPGYLAWDTGPPPEGVTFLGALPHADVIAEMRRAACLFYPQTSFAETFGLVMAEANAVGLPVLAHRDLGANAEVLVDPAQLVDGTDPDQIVRRLQEWRSAAPAVRGEPGFRTGAVARRWAVLLGVETVRSDTLEKVA